MSEKMHEYVVEQSIYGTVSEYVRSLIRKDQQERADDAARPVVLPSRAHRAMANAEALDHLEKLRAILER